MDTVFAISKHYNNKRYFVCSMSNTSNRIKTCWCTNSDQAMKFLTFENAIKMIKKMMGDRKDLTVMEVLIEREMR